MLPATHIHHIQTLLALRFGAIRDFTLIPSRQEHRAHYDVATFRTDDRLLVAKWLLPEDRSSLEVEDVATRLLSAAGIPTAPLVAFDPSERLIIFEHLEGVSCKDEILAAHAVQMADILRRMHALTEEGAPLVIPRYPAGTFQEEVSARFDAIRPAGQAYFADAWNEIERAHERLLAACAYSGTRGLCRIDPSASNWILRTDGSLWMVDHEDVSFADIANDLWRVQSQLWQTGASETFRDEYGAGLFDAATHPVVCALLDIRKCIRVLTRSAPRRPAYEERCRVRLARAIEYAKKELS